MLGDFLSLLHENEGALLVLATAVLAYVTWRLARESSIVRVSAVLAMTASIWEGNETAAVFRLRNYGQASATNVTIWFTWFVHGEQMSGQPRHKIELPVLAAGEARSYMPDTLIAQVGGRPVLGIEGMANAGWSVTIEWKWSDRRRRVLWFGEATHSDELTVDFASFRDAVHGPPNIIDPYRPDLASVIIPGVPGQTALGREEKP